MCLTLWQLKHHHYILTASILSGIVPKGELSLSQMGMCHRRLEFTTPFWSGKTQKVYPVLEPRTSIIYHVPLSKIMYCIVLYCIVLYCIVLYCMVLYCIVLYCLVLYCIVLYCIVLYCIVLYCIVSYHIVLNWIELCCIVLYCIVLETRTIFMLYLFNQMILPFHLSSTMFVKKSFRFSIITISLLPYLCFTYLIKWFYHFTLVLPCLWKKSFRFSVITISLSYDICSAFQN